MGRSERKWGRKGRVVSVWVRIGAEGKMISEQRGAEYVEEEEKKWRWIIISC